MNQPKDPEGNEEQRPPPAVPALFAALQGNPADADSWYKSGRAALDVKNYHLAARLLQASLRLNPNKHKAEHGLAFAHFCLGSFAEAAEACDRALRIDPGFIPSLVLRGQLGLMLGDPVNGRRFFDRAFELAERPWTMDSGLVHLAIYRGDEGAWERFLPGAPSIQLPPTGVWAPPPDRVWHGEVDRDATLCVYKDGGNGDIFFFARFIPAIADRVGQVFLTAPPTHDRLLASLPGLTGVVRHSVDLPDAKYVHLWSLPGIIGTKATADIVNQVVLKAPESGPDLSHLSGFKVGLTWSGSPMTSLNLDRAVPDAELLRPLFEIPGIDWVSLQIGYRAEEAEQLPFAARPAVNDFGDTAHLMDQLDLVLSVDTGVSNLAGALGRPLWVLAPTFPEFRWGAAEDRTTWYPSARLFRRADTRDWQGVIGRVVKALEEELGKRSMSRERGDMKGSGSA